MLTDQAYGGTRSLASSPLSAQASPFHLIVRDEDCHMSVFTVDNDGQRVLPVFSSKAEAESFRRSAAYGGSVEDGWRIRGCGNGEIVSLLFGSCREVRRVALDPASEFCTAEEADLTGVSLTGVSRACFVDRLMGRGRSWFHSSQNNVR